MYMEIFLAGIGPYFDNGINSIPIAILQEIYGECISLTSPTDILAIELLDILCQKFWITVRTAKARNIN